MSPPVREDLLATAQAFCNSFATKAPLETTLAFFSKTHEVSCIEHASQQLPSLPFLGQRFTGYDKVKEYFSILADVLSYEDMTFGEFMVDVDARKVACKGKATWTWTSTGESWKETFAYFLDFDDEARVTDYQVWSDTAAAYLANQGKLKATLDVEKSTSPNF